MDALLAIEAQGPGDPAGALEASGILESGIRSVHGAKSVSASRCNNAVHHGMPAMAGIQRIVIVEFASVAKAVEAHDSPEYQAALKAFDGCAERDLRIVEGLE